MNMQPEPESQVVDLREFFGVVRRRKWSMLLVALLVTSLALALVYLRTPTFTATALVSVQPLSASARLEGFAVDTFVNVDTEAKLITSDEDILKAAAAVPTLSLTPGSADDLAALSSDISVTVQANTTLLSIACTNPSAAYATDCANAVANAYITNRIQIAQQAYDDAKKGPLRVVTAATKSITALTSELAVAPADERVGLQSQIDAQNNIREAAHVQMFQIPTPNPTAARLVLLAAMPTGPSNKNLGATGLIAAILGFSLAIGLALVRERVDEQVRGRDGLARALQAPVIAVVPHVPSWRNKKESRVVTLVAPESPAAEAFRNARTAILYRLQANGIKVIEVSGPGEGEGKTTATVNLAVALAQAGRTVVAVSCDLRKPRLHRFFRLGNEVGLTTILSGQIGLREALRPTEVSGLSVIASGPVPSNPAELVGSGAMERVLDELRARFDIVLLDTPPALVVSDALALAPRSDGVLLVVDATTRRAAVVHLSQEFEGVGGRILGGILSNLDSKEAKRYPGSYRSRYSSGNYRAEEAIESGWSRDDGYSGRREEAQAPSAEETTSGRDSWT